MRVSTAILSIFILSGCALAPFTQGGPARPVGALKLESGLQWSGYASTKTVLTPIAKVRYGLSDRWTLSMLSETRTLVTDIQNAYYVDEPSGWFAAWNVGAAWGGGAVSYFIGHTLSARLSSWEPFVSLQCFLANIEPGAADPTFFTSGPALPSYFLNIGFGTRYWILEDMGVGLHSNVLLSTTSVTFAAPFIPSFSAFMNW